MSTHSTPTSSKSEKGTTMYFRNTKIERIFLLDADNNDSPQTMADNESFYSPETLRESNAKDVISALGLLDWLFDRMQQPHRVQPYLRLEGHKLLFPIHDCYREITDTPTDAATGEVTHVWQPMEESEVRVVFHHPRTGKRIDLPPNELIENGPPMESSEDEEFEYGEEEFEYQCVEVRAKSVPQVGDLDAGAPNFTNPEKRGFNPK